MIRYISHDLYIMMQAKLASQIHVVDWEEEDTAKEAKKVADEILKLNGTEVMSGNTTSRGI